MAIEGLGEVGDRSAFMMNSAGSEQLHVFANLSHPVCHTVLCDDRWWYSGMQRAQSCEPKLSVVESAVLQWISAKPHVRIPSCSTFW